MVKRFDYLAALATKYSLLCEASLRSDMAKRIMYSILPGVAGPTQTMATQGVVDYKALKAAAEGRKDIIKYGMRACMEELGHYEGTLSAQEVAGDAPTAFRRGRAYHAARAYADQGDYEKALDIAIQLFGDEDAWPPSYGGTAWLNITKTLKNIVVLDKNLEAVRANRAKDPEALDKEVTIMQQLIVAMNVFDGLSHNTASILSKLTNQEAQELTPEDSEVPIFDAGEAEFKVLQRMMDAKELRNPVQVFREIEPALQESGDIHRYKDWVSALHRDPTYRATDPNLENEKFLIRIRKQLAPFRAEINARRDFMRKGVEKILTAGPQSLMNLYRLLDTKTEEFANTIDRILQLIDDQYLKPGETAEMEISDAVKAGPVMQLREGIKKLSMDARLKVEMARNKLGPIVSKYHQQKQRGTVSQQTVQEFQTAVYETMNLIYSGYGSLAFYLDSI